MKTGGNAELFFDVFTDAYQLFFVISYNGMFCHTEIIIS
jgi:hypothetical protein